MNRKGKISLDKILKRDHPQYQIYKLKLRLLDKGILDDKCSLCGWQKTVEGMDRPSCELDPIDRNPLNRKIENLRIICPNCHSLTKTYHFRCGKINNTSESGEAG